LDSPSALASEAIALVACEVGDQQHAPFALEIDRARATLSRASVAVGLRLDHRGVS